MVLLQHQLQEADSAVAAATSEASSVVTRSRRTQTRSASEVRNHVSNQKVNVFLSMLFF